VSDPIKREVLVCVPRTNSDYSYSEEIASYILELGDQVAVVDSNSQTLLKDIDYVLRENRFIKTAVVVSPESSKAVHYLWKHDVLSVLIMPKWGTLRGMTKDYAKYCSCVGSFIFHSHEERTKSLECFQELKSIKYNIVSPGSLEGFKNCLQDLGKTLPERIRKEISDRKVISRSRLFSPSFAAPWNEGDARQSIANYTSSWRTAVHRRKPFPGFHPGIYAEACKLTDCNPFVHFITSGKPTGPWTTKTISPGLFRGFMSHRSRLNAALHLHLFYSDMADELVRRIKASRSSPDLFISVPTDKDLEAASRKFTIFTDRKVEIRVVPNIGRDIGPFLTEFSTELQDYDVIGHIHTKKSFHQEKRHLIDEWSNFLFENVIGGKNPMIDVALQEFEKDPLVGLIYPDDPSIFGWMGNRDIAIGLMQRMGLSHNLSLNSINFPVGTMFWARPKALKPLFDLNLDWGDYPEEPVPDDGTMLHAIERIIPLVVKEMGFREAVTYVKGVSR
jgi:hypothetical protein